MANKPVFGSPVYRDVLTVSTGKAVSILSTSDATGVLQENGMPVVTLSNSAGTFTGTYTPSSVGNKTLTFVGDVTGVSAGVIVSVDAANLLQPSVSHASWNKSNTTATTTTIPIPRSSNFFSKLACSASGSSRRLTYTSVTGNNTVPQGGRNIWAGYDAACKTPVVFIQTGAASCWLNLKTEEANIGSGYITCVERTVDATTGAILKRFQLVEKHSNTTQGANTYLDLHQTINEADTWTLAAGDLANAYIYIGDCRHVDDVELPFTDSDKFGAYLDATTTATLVSAGVTGAQNYLYKTPLLTDEQNASIGGGPGGLNMPIVMPGAPWVKPSKGWPVMIFLKALSDATETGGGNKTAYQAMTIDDYANTFGFMCLTYEERVGGYWPGCLNDGTNNSAGFLCDVLPLWLQKVMGASGDPNDMILVSYSKGAWGGAGSKILRPDRFGFAVCGDTPFLNNAPTFPSNNNNLNFTNYTAYLARDPYTQLAANLLAVNDAARLVLCNGPIWGTDYTAMVTRLNANGVPFITSTALTTHAWGPTGTNGGWTRAAVNAVMVQRAKVIAARKPATFFF